VDVPLIAQRVKEHRLRRKLSQRQLDAKAGVSHGYVSKLELGQVNPTLGQLRKIAVALAVPVEDLIGGEVALEAEPELAPEEQEREEAFEFLRDSTKDLPPAEIRRLASVLQAIRTREEEGYDAYMRAKPPEQYRRRRDKKQGGGETPP
jgi:XRE family transcriptional regulator, fatty acid utilization regulator